MTKARKNFDLLVERAMHNPFLQVALDQNAERRKQARAQGSASLPQSFEELRQRAHDIKKRLIDHWDKYLENFIQKTRENGFQVHLANDAISAQQIVEQLIKEVDAKIVVKAKTMVGEEIQADEAILRAGAIPIETDLGEYIVQLRGEPPPI
jgi:L-lactate dehydrogenase complex protein LldF